METITSAPTPRFHLQCVAIGHRTLVLGGLTSEGVILDSVPVFDTKSLRWSTCKWKLPEPRYSFVVSYHPVNETLIIYGGKTTVEETPSASYLCSMKSISASSEVKCGTIQPIS
jgi:hypothetical protein